MMQVGEEKETVPNQRIFGHIKGDGQGPTLVFFGGIHGNEPAGVAALKSVFEALEQKSHDLKGEVYALLGNMAAYGAGQRFQEEDLNRIWLPRRVAQLGEGSPAPTADGLEMKKLHRAIHHILDTSAPPFYFYDIHTTSGKTAPFLVVNDSLLNRRYTAHYPLPSILGIEEYLHGALLSYINELGYVSFGFEAGQHLDPNAVEVAKDFIWYSMALAGCFGTKVQDLKDLKKRLSAYGPKDARFFEIYHQYDIQPGEHFQMMPGFDNFQVIPKGTPLAHSNGRPIITQKKRRIFMPLYQKKGSEGFYYIRKTPRLFLALSSYLRKWRADEVLARLPGVSWASAKKEALMVDRRVARYFAKSVFHLLGFRAREQDKAHFIVRSREEASKTTDYLSAPWYKKSPWKE